jgi:drug/metabolite transporter (DMT)-like permease
MLKCLGRFVGEVYLLLSVLFFGVAFVVMRYAMFYKLGPQSFNAGRFLFATLCLVLTKYVGVMMENAKAGSLQPKVTLWGLFTNSNNLLWGSALGVANFTASGFMQSGLATVDANRAGFIVGMYVVFVPIAETCVPGLKSKLSARPMLAALLSLFGLYLMSGCAEESVCMGGAVGDGEVLMVMSMVVWVVSIICCSIGSKLVDPIMLTVTNFLVATICSIAFALILEPEVWVWPMRAFTQEWAVLSVVGVLQAAGFALSTLGQQYSTPTVAALIMSQETVVCAVVSYLALNETLSAVEMSGCAIMLVATVLALVSCGESHDSGQEDFPRNWVTHGPFEEDRTGLLELGNSADGDVDFKNGSRRGRSSSLTRDR